MKRERKWVLNRKTMYLDKGDRRLEEFAAFKKEHGFSPDEVWNLDITILAFALPRLIYFRDSLTGYPMGMTASQWEDILNRMIEGIQLRVEKNMGSCRILTDEEWEKAKEGVKLFLEHFWSLWY